MSGLDGERVDRASLACESAGERWTGGGGERLRALREGLGLSLRQVQWASEKLATKYRNPAFAINKARLSDIESKAILPNIYKLYALSAVYGRNISELLEFYDLETGNLAADTAAFRCRTRKQLLPWHFGAATTSQERPDSPSENMAVPSINSMIEAWGPLTTLFLAGFENSPYSFGYIGTEDRSMFPLILPGSFVQVDESRRRVVERRWNSVYERPIYFVETRDGFACSWCSLDGLTLVLQPHPLSAVPIQRYKNGSEAEVIGQIVAVAMRLDQFAPE